MRDAWDVRAYLGRRWANTCKPLGTIFCLVWGLLLQDSTRYTGHSLHLKSLSDIGASLNRHSSCSDCSDFRLDRVCSACYSRVARLNCHTVDPDLLRRALRQDSRRLLHRHWLRLLHWLLVDGVLAELSQTKAVRLVIDRDSVLHASHVTCALLILGDHSIADVVSWHSPVVVLVLGRDVLFYLYGVAVTRSIVLLLLHKVSEALTCLILVEIVLCHVI